MIYELPYEIMWIEKGWTPFWVKTKVKLSGFWGKKLVLRKFTSNIEGEKKIMSYK